MEEAQLKSGNGLVDRKRSEGMKNMHGMSVGDYAKMRQANQPGNEIYETKRF